MDLLKAGDPVYWTEPVWRGRNLDTDYHLGTVIEIVKAIRVKDNDTGVTKIIEGKNIVSAENPMVQTMRPQNFAKKAAGGTRMTRRTRKNKKF